MLVTVPTGTGKTLMAKAALHAAIGRGHRAVYTTPLRALTEEKYRELCADFGDENVGFATGDYKVNREAPIQVEVAEFLWNRIVADKHVCPAETVFGEHTLVVALGLDATGRKHALGLREGSTENATLCQALLADLVARGVPADRALLVVLDGGYRDAERGPAGVWQLRERPTLLVLKDL